MEGHQKKIQYPGWYKNATGKGLLSGKGNEVIYDVVDFKEISKY